MISYLWPKQQMQTDAADAAWAQSPHPSVPSAPQISSISKAGGGKDTSKAALPVAFAGNGEPGQCWWRLNLVITLRDLLSLSLSLSLFFFPFFFFLFPPFSLPLIPFVVHLSSRNLGCSFHQFNLSLALESWLAEGLRGKKKSLIK